MISDISDYFTKGCGRCARFATPDCSVQTWADGLARLRAICLNFGLSENVKWGHPCYMHGDRNIAVFGAFRSDFRISFMNGSLLKDPHDILEPIGPNSRSRTVIRFRNAQDVTKRDPILREYLAELIAYADAGLKPAPRHQDELVLADELVDAMDTDPAFAAAFNALTPGRKRGWTLHFNSAKQSKTRQNRITKARDKILSGKGWSEG